MVLFVGVYMKFDNTYEELIKKLRGSTIAIVYFFEKEDAIGLNHYWVWKSDIISGWLNAVQELKCLPFILDVRTFVQKASDRTLSHIDYVLNLNCGCYELSSLSLVPSICSFLSIPCVPCNAVSIVTSENKRISNLIAYGMNLTVPKSLDTSCNEGIYRPLNLGSSIGVKKGCFYDFTNDGIYQEFIPGYDVTIPIVYNPYINDIDLFPPILYLPKSLASDWIYSEEEKINDNGFITLPFLEIEEKVRKELINFSHVFPIQTFGRIDARIRCSDEKLSAKIIEKPLGLNDLYFIEMNSMPTIERGDSFEVALDAVQKNKHHSFYDCTKKYREIITDPTINGFLLSCSMLSLSTAMC
jgi:hypothetical protein